MIRRTRLALSTYTFQKSCFLRHPNARLWDRDILQFKDSTAELGFLPASSHTRLCVFIYNRDSTRFITCSSFNEVNRLINKLTEESMTRQTQKWVSLS